MPTLYLGNKNYSSWSMRPWLALTWSGLAFEERVLELGMLGYGKSQMPDIQEASPSGRVPVLHLDGGEIIWDSLAICEWAAETAPDALLWPEDANARALCRSVVAEMHSGFAALRREAPVNIRRKTVEPPWTPDSRGDIDRIEDMWHTLRTRFAPEGPYLFGERTIADAFYAPIATRFRTYNVALAPVCKAYVSTILADAAVRAWEQAARAEKWTQPDIDRL